MELGLGVKNKDPPSNSVLEIGMQVSGNLARRRDSADGLET